MFDRVTMIPSYLAWWNTCKPGVLPSKAPKRDVVDEINHAIAHIATHTNEYDAVERLCGVPHWFVGLLHWREANGDFTKHLHNGDNGYPNIAGLLTRRTTHVPSGRPVIAMPCSWEYSAVDALTNNPDNPSLQWGVNKIRKVNNIPDWSLPTVLWRFNAWNGFGDNIRHRVPGYLWEGSNLEQQGKFVADGVFDNNVWSKQVGVGTILKEMVLRNFVKF